jgi:prepilin-type N-terminal cleavage/methylation domain-containing protein
MAPRRDDGFSLLETVVAIALISVMAAALSVVLVQAGATNRRHSDRRVAAQLAVDAIERAGQLPGEALLAGRTQSGVMAQPLAAGVADYFAGGRTEQVWADGGPASGGLPTTAQAVPATPFAQNWYVGACWQPVAGGACTAALTPQQRAAAVPFLRVIVAVTWPARECAPQRCSYVTSTLIGRQRADPLYHAD